MELNLLVKQLDFVKKVEEEKKPVIFGLDYYEKTFENVDFEFI